MSDNSLTTFETWRDREATAEAMIPMIGRLYRDRDVITYIFGVKVVRESAVGIMRAHRRARLLIGHELSVFESYPILEAMRHMDLDSAKVDIGKLAVQYAQEGDGRSVDEFLQERLARVLTGIGQLLDEPTDVVLYGFGRIGRLVARILIDRSGGGSKLRLRAIVLRPSKNENIHKRASLLRRDSVHGPFNGTILVDEENSQIIANGNIIQIIYADRPDTTDYTKFGIDDAIVIDNTGAWRDEEGLGQHLKSTGVARVLLTAPGKGAVKNIIYGINHKGITDEDDVLSAASCTTNAIVPVLKLMNDLFGINSGHVESIHSYTNDQNLTDNFHDKDRRGRSAPLNMVITETGAASAVAKALPELEGKLTGSAIRVPTPNVSLAILNLNLDTDTTKEAINQHLRSASLDDKLHEQIEYRTSNELVSSDLVGSERTSIVDGPATIADGKRCVLYVWYDNEMGYSYQVIRILQDLAGLRYPQIP